MPKKIIKPVVSAQEAVKCIKSGDSVMVGGFNYGGIPYTLTDALYDQGTDQLTLISNDTIYEFCGQGKLVAGGRFISLLLGGSFFSSDTSFGLIRGGHIDATVLGTLEVDQHGDLANWWIPGKSVPGMGGAMDLVVGARRVYVAMTHVTKKGAPKILKKCTLPLTAVGVVDMVVTEFAVFTIKDGKVTLIEIAPEVTQEQIRANTEADYEVAEDIAVYRGLEVA